VRDARSDSYARVHRVGLAGGLINATQQIGGAIGLAVITAVATSYTSSDAHSPTNVVHGFQAGLLVAAGLAAAAMVLAAILVPARERMAPPATATTDRPPPAPAPA
jgi:hypothetical protein